MTLFDNISIRNELRSGDLGRLRLSNGSILLLLRSAPGCPTSKEFFFGSPTWRGYVSTNKTNKLFLDF